MNNPLNRRLEGLLAHLFPSAPDDLMAVAEATGVTPTSGDDEPVPYTPTDRIPFPTHEQQNDDVDELLVAHEAACTLTEAMAEERRLTLAGRVDWNLWEAELLS